MQSLDVRSRSESRATDQPTFVDVFAGCGGLSLGLKRAGWRGRLAIEKDQFAFDTLAANFLAEGSKYPFDWCPDIEKRPWELHELIDTHHAALTSLAGTIDLLAGGPPCQGFSHAGRRRPDDPRNRLFEKYLELVAILKPRLVLIENVRGFTADFAKPNERGIKNFAAELRARLMIEYDTTDKVIRASDFGVPQSRPRFFLVGVRRGEGQHGILEDFFARLTANTRVFLAARGLPNTSSARDAISDLEVHKNGKISCADSPGFEAIAYSAPRTPFQKAMQDGHAGPLSDTRLARHRPDISLRFAAIIKACGEDGRLNMAISAELRQIYGLKKVALRVLDPLTPAPTITSLPDDLIHYSEPRTLTVRENARLQTFPDWFSFCGKYTTGGDLRRAEIPRFTQVANAVPPLLAEQIGATLLQMTRDRSNWRFV